MAIQIDLTQSKYGITFSGAYFRIKKASVSRKIIANQKFSVIIDVYGYATSNPSEDASDVDFRRYVCSLDDIEAQQGAAFLDKCYAWVMAQPDMAGSVAV